MDLLHKSGHILCGRLSCFKAQRLWRSDAQAIAAILQDDTSAIATLKSSGLDRPAKLDGRTYASYGARYEGRIVQRMIRNDGGSGDYKEVALPMLGIWETILKVSVICSRCVRRAIRSAPMLAHTWERLCVSVLRCMALNPSQHATS